MIELRWVYLAANPAHRQLQYRTLTPNVDASGALCPPGEWSEWKPVGGVLSGDGPDDAKWHTNGTYC